jgi:hypothetical protein
VQADGRWLPAETDRDSCADIGYIRPLTRKFANLYGFSMNFVF